MTKEEKIEAIKQRAKKNFSLGYNCAECVTEAVLAFVETGLPPEARKWPQVLAAASASSAIPAVQWRER